MYHNVYTRESQHSVYVKIELRLENEYGKI